MIRFEHKAAKRLRWLFVGSTGLRAGWGVLLLACVFFAAEIAIEWLAGPRMKLPAGPISPGIGYFHEVTPLAIVLRQSWD